MLSIRAGGRVTERVINNLGKLRNVYFVPDFQGSV